MICTVIIKEFTDLSRSLSVSKLVQVKVFIGKAILKAYSTNRLNSHHWYLCWTGRIVRAEPGGGVRAQVEGDGPAKVCARTSDELPPTFA